MRNKKPCYIIAEAGVNHNGSLKLCKELIDQAAEAGVNAVKFQTFRADELVSHSAPKARYQLKTTEPGESQYEMLKKLELNEAAHEVLSAHCQKRGIDFLSSPFDLTSVELLTHKLKLRRLKVPSGEITNAPLILKMAETQLPLIVSTGMSTLKEVREALAVIAFGYVEKKSKNHDCPSFERAFKSKQGQMALKEKITLLHCTTEYPAPYSEANLHVMDTLRDQFGLEVGLSDHTSGIAVSIAAVARGASVIEKHFTLDRNLIGPDHQGSLEPQEFKVLVESIRQVEQAVGSYEKKPTRSELKNMPLARKSLIAARPIKKGEPFTSQNITSKRPGTGTSPMHYWELLNQKSDRDYKRDEMVCS